jgi:excisionase family DNA binding protein
MNPKEVKMLGKDDKILGVEQLAKFFGVSDQTIWRWCKSGKLPAFKIGSQWKIRQSDLNRIINQKLSRKPKQNNPTLF